MSAALASVSVLSPRGGTGREGGAARCVWRKGGERENSECFIAHALRQTFLFNLKVEFSDQSRQSNMYVGYLFNLGVFSDFVSLQLLTENATHKQNVQKISYFT